MTEKFIELAEQFYVSPQLEVADIAHAKALGIKLIICNRPDNEEAGQTSSSEIETAAQDAGIRFTRIPVDGRGIARHHIDDFSDVMKDNEGPVLAYCRSGTRSTMVRAFYLASHGGIISEIVGEASKAGYDLFPIVPSLEAVLPERRKKPRT